MGLLPPVFIASLMTFVFAPDAAAGASYSSSSCNFSMCGSYDDGVHQVDFACDLHTLPSGDKVNYAIFAIAQVTSNDATLTRASCELNEFQALGWLPGPAAVGAKTGSIPPEYLSPVYVLCWGFSVDFLNGDTIQYYVGNGGLCDIYG